MIPISKLLVVSVLCRFVDGASLRSSLGTLPRTESPANIRMREQRVLEIAVQMLQVLSVTLASEILLTHNVWLDLQS